MSGQHQPDYVVGLRLNRLPFDTDCDEAFFFADPSLTQRLEQLQRLTEVGGKILVIEGVAGSGRTTLLQELVRRAAGGWRVCRVAGADLAEPAAALRELARQYRLGETGHPDQLRRLIADWCRVAARTSRLPVLVIDDAERVPRTVLEQVLTLCGPPAETVQTLRVLLFGLPGLHESLVKAGVGHNHRSLIQTLAMPPLDAAQTEAYLLYRLSVAGYAGASPFSPLEVRAIQEVAAGLRGRINQLAHQTLSGHLWALPSRGRYGDQYAGGPPRRLRGVSKVARWVGAGVAAVLVAGVFWWAVLSPQGGDTPPAAIVTRELALPVAETASTRPAAVGGQVPQLSPAAPVSAGPPMSTVDDHEAAAGNTGERPLPLPLPALPSVTTAALETVQVTPADSANSQAAPVVPNAGDNGGLESPGAAATAPVGNARHETSDGDRRPAERPAPVTETRWTVDDSGVYREDWLSSQPPDAVTLQVVAVSRDSSLRQFLKQHQLAEPTAYFHTLRNGKDWYVVVHGVYPDRRAASDAIATLPEAIREGGPWPRTFASIHTDIQAGAAP